MEREGHYGKQGEHPLWRGRNTMVSRGVPIVEREGHYGRQGEHPLWRGRGTHCMEREGHRYILRGITSTHII